MNQRRMKKIATKIVENNLKKDGWKIIRSPVSGMGPSDIHAVKDDRLFLVHVNSAVYPEESQRMKSNRRDMLRFLARKMKAVPYAADVVLNPDMTVKDLRYYYVKAN
jgi:Holliday junction resolvase